MLKKEEKLMINIINQKYISDEQYKKANRLLESIKEYDESFYIQEKAKLLFNVNKIREAKKLILENNLFDNNSSMSYTLYKIAVNEKELDKAYTYLLNYCKCIIKELKFPSLAMPIVLLEQYKDLENNPIKYFTEDKKIKNTNRFNKTEIKDEEIEELYINIIKSINDKNYTEAKYQIDEITEKLYSKNIYIEFYTIKLIIEQIEEKLKEELPKILENELDSNTHYIILKTAYLNNSIEYIDVLKGINKLINRDHKLGKLLLEEIKYDQKEEDYRLELNYLKKKIDEKEKYEALTEEEKKEYHAIIEKGRNRDVDMSLYQYYLEGYQKLNHPIFNYYIGKTLYKMFHFEEAKEYFIEYIKEGGDKLNKALLYLNCIKYRQYEFNECNQLLDYLDAINKFEEEDFKVYKVNESKLKLVDKVNEIIDTYRVNKKVANKMLNKLERSSSKEDKRLIKRMVKENNLR